MMKSKDPTMKPAAPCPRPTRASQDMRDPRQAIRRAQALLRRYVPPSRSLADEILADRRAEAARE